AALVVAGFIGWAGYQIARATTRILSDRMVIAESDLEQVVLGVPGVLGCHHIRTRGSSDHVFLDLHVWLPAEMHLLDAHALSHVVKDRLMARYPQIADAIIHIEPPPIVERDGRTGEHGAASPAPPRARSTRSVGRLVKKGRSREMGGAVGRACRTKAGGG